MSDAVRQYLAVFIIGAVAGLGTFALLVVSRLVQPASTFVRRGLVPRPLAWLTRWARSRTLRIWSTDPALLALVITHMAGPLGGRLRRLGVSPVTSPALADVVVLGSGSPLPADLAEVVPQPFTILRLDEPDDAGAVLEAFVDLAVRIRVDALDAGGQTASAQPTPAARDAAAPPGEDSTS